MQTNSVAQFLTTQLTGFGLNPSEWLIISRADKEQKDQLQEVVSRTLAAPTTNQLPEVETPYTPNYSVTEQATYPLPQPPKKERQ